MRTRAACLALCLLSLAGCGGGHGKAPNRRTRTPVEQAQTTHEYPSPGPPAENMTRPGPWPMSAVAAFATAYINWNAQTVSSDMRALAARSVGQARSAMQLAAAQTASDYELQRGGIANRGVVEAVAPLRGQRDRYVVVTRELTTAAATTAYQGLAPAWHVAIATVAELAPGQWAVSEWQPQG